MANERTNDHHRSHLSLLAPQTMTPCSALWLITVPESANLSIWRVDTRLSVSLLAADLAGNLSIPVSSPLLRTLFPPLAPVRLVFFASSNACSVSSLTKKNIIHHLRLLISIPPKKQPPSITLNSFRISLHLYSILASSVLIICLSTLSLHLPHQFTISLSRLYRSLDSHLHLKTRSPWAL
jgi:hypothetical protein